MSDSSPSNRTRSPSPPGSSRSRFEASSARSSRSRSSRRSASIIDSSSARCSGLIERMSDCIAAIRCGQLVDDVVEALGAREEPAVLGEEVAHVRVAAADPLADELVEVADHLAVRGEVLRGHGPDGVAHPADELVEDLLAEPLDELVEAGARVGLEEVVLAQVADPLADVARQRVELIEPLRGDVAEQLLEVGVGGLGVVQRRPRRGRRARRSAGRGPTRRAEPRSSAPAGARRRPAPARRSPPARAGCRRGRRRARTARAAPRGDGRVGP